jgi:hypothetical protein
MGYAYFKKGDEDKTIECWVQAARFGNEAAMDILKENDVAW